MPVDVGAEHEIETADQNDRLTETIFNRAKERLIERRHEPLSTYRLQFNRFFTFEQARKLIEYFDKLGISDLYASPFFKARAESLHGYDIASHNELNPAIGSERDLDKLVEELRKRGMYQILDTVPNHMGIGEEGNAWWMDVLENGRSSVYAPFFDIDWDPLNIKITNKVLLPVLGDQYGKVLENKELQVKFLPDEGRFVLCYWENTFPINPCSYIDILELNRDSLVQELGPESEAAVEYQSIITAISHLPDHWISEPDKVQERNREKEVVKRRLATLCSTEPRVRDFIERNVEVINGVASEPASFDRLDALLDRQPYRLSYWRVATEEINYRRFFDVNDLAAIRIDQPQVFVETHRMIMRFMAQGKLNGLRIDHVDGLRDPAGYFRALQRGYFLEICRQVMDEMGLPGDGSQVPGVRDQHPTPDVQDLESRLLGLYEAEALDPQSAMRKPLYVVVEKILARGESLPADWMVDGTTGYEYTNAVNGLFIDSANQKAFDEVYSSFIKDDVKFADLVYESKRRIMQLSLASEVTVLTNMLNRITQRDRNSRDFTIESISSAIREVIACFPVYRTYITPEHTEVDKRDRGYIETAINRAKKRNPAADPTIFDFIRDILLLKGYGELSQEERDARFDFVMKFQQVTGPVIAKGLEDTAFYNYNRLISLNEVGGEPDLFGISIASFHKLQSDRLKTMPFSLLTTSTHDTKRSEDVRVRIDVLSEMPREWRTAVRRWARINRKHKKNVDGQPAPSRNEEYFLYQTLLGVWPSMRGGVQRAKSPDGVAGVSPDALLSSIDDRGYKSLIERLQTYMRKALNEAKVNSSWVNQNEPYLSAVCDFVAAILRRDESNRFLPEFLALQEKIACYGAFNSLSQVLLKITSPGVPDIYQGNEIWDFSLVDPDNRRPVDYELRRKMLKDVEKVKSPQDAARLVAAREDGRIKLLVTNRALNFRRDNKELFRRGAYTPLEVRGKYQENVIAYARSYRNSMALVVAPCLMTKLGRSGDLTVPVGSVWSGAWLQLPGASAGDRFRNKFTNEIIEVREQSGAAGLALEEVLATFPVALLDGIPADK